MIQRRLVLAILCVSVMGCGGGADLPPTAKVKGTVTYKGEPLKSGTIVFYPENGRSASGEIKNGEFLSLTTFAPDDGAAMGKHKVTVEAFNAPAGDMYTKRKSLLPAKYGSVKTTDQIADVVAGENSVKFELKD